ncbi:MAG: type IV secretory system conjugative DNA transfer family protein [Bacteroidota bacterium]
MPKPIAGREMFHLDHTLVQLSASDAWTIRDACEGTQVFGATGSGKTSGSGQAIAKAMLANGFGGLVLTAKPDEAALWERYAAQTGRSASVLRFGRDDQHRFNFLNAEARRGDGEGITSNLVELFATVLESAEGEGGRGNDPFWPRALRQLLRNTVELLILARQPVRLTDMASLIASAPQSPEQVKDQRWQRSSELAHRLIEAQHHASTPRERGDLEVTARFWCEEFPGLAERTRSSIVATFTTMADGFIRGKLRDLFCTETTVTPELTHEGVVLIVDLPVKQYHEVGRLAQILWKYCWQRATESRVVNAHTRPVFLWADESHLFVTPRDLEFQSTARSARACTVYLTQNLPAYFAQIGGPKPEDATDALLGVLQTKILHANGDARTNEWVERTVAKHWTHRTSTSKQDKPAGENTDPLKGHSFSSSSSPSLENELLARELTLLRTGGPRNNRLVDALVFQAGKCWNATGTNWLKTTFRQS